MAFKNFQTRDIGTSETAVTTTPSAGYSQVVLGMTICNISASPVSVDAYVKNGANLTRFLKGFPLPVGEAVVPQGMLGKQVLLNGDTICVLSDTATSLDVNVSVTEDINT